MKKKLLATMLCLIMAVSMTACGTKEEKQETTKKETQASETKAKKTEKTEKKEETKTEDKDEDEVVPGSSKSNAYLLPLNTKVFGTVKAGEYAWFSFETGDDAEATYNVTFVNESVGTQELYGELMDEYGTVFDDNHAHDAESDGRPFTIEGTELEPNTTYYVQLYPHANEDIDYSLVIKNPSDTSSAYKTIGNVSEAVGSEVQDGDTVTTVTNINDSIEIPLGAGVHGTVLKKQAAWFSFTTGEQEGATYNVTFVNDSPKSTGDLEGELMDEYGNIFDENHAHDSGNDGKPYTITSNELKPNTTYYVQLYPQSYEDLDYSITIKSPDAEKKESNLVFETPFEINDTQIQFVADSDKFIDEAQAKEVLKPVADAILKHPDSSVLLAGTTATDGPQASAVELSNRRAEAVKNLLVSAYKVPESQLQTVGLGFEADPFERGRDRDSSGKFVESEGRKNRRVVVMDAADPIAQEILKK